MSVRAIAIVVFLCGGVAQAAPPRLALRVPAGLDCPDRATIERALRTRLGETAIADERSTLTLDVARLPARRLHVRLTDGSAEVARSLPGDAGPCAAIADGIALLVDSWLESRGWWAAPAATAEAPAEPDAPPAPVTSPAVTREPAASATVERSLSQDGGRSVHLRLALAGGAQLGIGRSATYAGHGLLSCELELSQQWAFGLRIALTSLFDDLGGSIAFRRSPLTLYGRFALHAPAHYGFAFGAGLSLEMTWVHGNDWADWSPSYDPALWMMARWEYVFAGRYVLFVEADGSVLVRPDATRIGSDPGVLPRAWLSATLGLAVRM